MRLKCKFIFSEIGDNIIAIPAKNSAFSFNGMIRLNDTAKIIMELLCEDTTEEIIVNTICSQNDQYDPNEIRNYVSVFIKKLNSMNLLFE